MFPNSEAKTQTIIKGYQLIELVGEGGFGAVYRAHQTIVGREVAMKVILPKYANNPDFIRRFDSEAQLVARLEHPFIVPLFDYWRDPEGAYLVMRYLRGGSLRDGLAKGAFPAPHAVRIIEQIAAALALAHHNDVIHRDIKPDNILLDEQGNAYLSDFGIAKPSSETRTTNSVTGSLSYIAPEQLQIQDLTPQTDIYLLGIVVYEIMTGKHPFANVTPSQLVQLQLHEPLPGVTDVNLNAVIQRATAKDPTNRYEEVSALATAFRQAVLGNQTAPTLTEISWTPLKNPYKGLLAFEEADAANFFGREALVDLIIERLRETRFLAVVGSSGCGKSSLVKAGVLPKLRAGALPGSERWYMAEMMPSHSPLANLQTALLSVAPKASAYLEDQLRSDKRGLLWAAEAVLMGTEGDLVLVIDQFEELFTLTTDENERAQFLELLRTAATDPKGRVHLILTLRADFMDKPLQYAEFGELLRSYIEFALPMNTEQIERAVRGPATRIGLKLQPELLAAVVSDVRQEPGALPLLQHALNELFERREGQQMTLAAYEASGGVTGALARRADEVYVSLPSAQQQATRQIFLRLVTLGEGVEDTRRRARRDELLTLATPETVNAVLEAFGKYRLLTFDNDASTRIPMVEVAHEAVIRTWGRLREWLDTSRADIRLQRLLASAATEWANSNYKTDYLFRGARLAQFEEWSKTSGIVLTSDESTYLNACLKERQAQEAREADRFNREAKLEQRSRRFLRALVGVLLVAVVLALGLSGFAFQSSRSEHNARATSEANYTRSESLRLAAEATSILQTPNSNWELAALLSLRSLQRDYSSQAESALGKSLSGLNTLREFKIEEGEIFTAIFSPDGRYILTGGEDHMARLWDVETGEEVQRFVGHTLDVVRVAFTPDGKQIITASDDQTVRVWDVASGKELRQFEEHPLSLLGMALSPDGTLLATGIYDGTVRVFDFASGKLLYMLAEHTDPVAGLTFSPDNQYLLTSSWDGFAKLWDAQTGAPVREYNIESGIESVTFSADGKHILMGIWDDCAVQINAETGEEEKRYLGHSNSVYGAKFSPDGRFVLTASEDGTGRLWNLQTEEYIKLTGHSNALYSGVFSPDGRYVLTASADGSARLWDANGTDSGLKTIQQRNVITRALFSPDGQYILTASYDRVARLWDAKTLTVIREYSGHTDFISSAAFSPDGQHFATGSWDTTVRVWDVNTVEPLYILTDHRVDVLDVAFSPDGHILATSSGDATRNDDTIRLWDAATGKPLQVFETGDFVNMIRFSANGDKLLISSYEGGAGVAKILDTTTGEVLHRYPHDSGVWSVAFSPDERTIATGDEDSVIHLWDVASEKEIASFVGQNAVIRSLIFTLDGRYLISGSNDIRFWDVNTGKQARILSGHSALVVSLALSPDGKTLISGAEDSSARLWDISLDDYMAFACTRLFRDFTSEERQAFELLDSSPTCPQFNFNGSLTQ